MIWKLTRVLFYNIINHADIVKWDVYKTKVMS